MEGMEEDAIFLFFCMVGLQVLLDLFLVLLELDGEELDFP
jgi:hypothetical protein